MAPGRRLRAALLRQTQSTPDPPITPTTIIETSGSATQSADRQKKGRGPSRGITLEKKINENGGRPLHVTIPIGKLKPIGPNAKYFTNHLGYVLRQFGPIQVDRFFDIKLEEFQHLYPYVEDKFDVNIMEDETVMNCVHSIWGEQFHNHRVRMHKHFKSFTTLAEARAHPYRQISKDDWEWVCDNIFSNEKWKTRSNTNSENISKQTIRHSTGQKSFLRAREEMEQMLTIMSEAEGSRTSMSDIEVVSRVLGTRSGYVNGMGHGEPSTSSTITGHSRSSSTHNELQETKKELVQTKESLSNLAKEFQQFRSQFGNSGSKGSGSYTSPAQ